MRIYGLIRSKATRMYVPAALKMARRQRAGKETARCEAAHRENAARQGAGAAGHDPVKKAREAGGLRARWTMKDGKPGPVYIYAVVGDEDDDATGLHTHQPADACPPGGLQGRADPSRSLPRTSATGCRCRSRTPQLPETHVSPGSAPP